MNCIAHFCSRSDCLKTSYDGAGRTKKSYNTFQETVSGTNPELSKNINFARSLPFLAYHDDLAKSK